MYQLPTFTSAHVDSSTIESLSLIGNVHRRRWKWNPFDSELEMVQVSSTCWQLSVPVEGTNLPDVSGLYSIRIAVNHNTRNQLKFNPFETKISGALLWPYWHPWPQQPKGLIKAGFEELAKRWVPILDVFEDNDVNACFEVHPGEDIHDGETFEMFLKASNNHKRVNILYDPSHFVLQQLDYVTYIDHYHEFIKAFHVKDSEFKPNGKKGAFGGYGTWKDRAGRYRSPGDGQIDFKTIFTKLTEYGCDVWAVMEWECCVKSPEQGAKEGAKFIQNHIVEATQKIFDDFAGGDTDKKQINKILNI